ncbi:MAG: M81 family metallopeptidase [Verrucomicrobiota bacterium]|nr:M81 family metallopeptidase [Verrucomicrobiota bacterium]
MTPQPRVLCAGLFHETHTFVDGSTPLGAFEFRRGKKLLECMGDSSPWGGALERARTLNWQVEPLLDARAQPSAIVEDAVLEEFWRAFRQDAQRWSEPDIDGIFLVLHGAMVTPSWPDAEGELLRRIREELGWTRVPIAAVLDLHANVTPLMARHASALVAYRQNPHTDARESAQRAVRLLDRQMTGGPPMQTSWRGTPIVWPPAGTGTASPPMATLETMARELEQSTPGVLEVNVCAGFSFADMRDAGVSFSLVHTADCSKAAEILDRLEAAAWERREEGNVRGVPADQVVALIRDESSGPFVLAEESDNIGAGAPGDGTGLLRVLIEHRVENAAVCLADAPAVRQLQDLPPGARVTLPLGGRGSRYDAGPLTLEVEVHRHSEGRFELEDKQSHLASLAGDSFDMGPCTLVEHRGILILLTSRATPPMDLGQWRSVGVEPSKLKVIAVKAAVAHRRAYDPITRANFLVDTPGPCCGDLRKLNYRHIRRPVFPLDSLDQAP